MPFSIPESWTWCRLGTLTAKIGSGSTPKGGKAVYQDSGIKFIRSQNVYNDGLRLDGIAFISSKINDEMSGTVVRPNDILLNITGASIGRCALVPESFDTGNVNQHVSIIRLIDNNLAEYVHLVLCSRYIFDKIMEKQVGETKEGLSATATSMLLIPLPPINEQIRIVQNVRQICEIAVVHKLFHKKVLIYKSQLKKSILLSAIQGKLVPQNNNDKPVQIQCKNPIIRRDNSYYESGTPVYVPFEIPDSWTWVRGKDVFEKQTVANIAGNYFTYIDIDSIDNNSCSIAGCKTIETKNAPSRAKRHIETGDVLFSLVRPYLKNIALVTEQYCNSIASTGFFVCRSKYYDSRFLYYMMISKYVVDGINKKMKGDNSPSVRKEDLLHFLYPLPPLNEQKRIAEKIERLTDLTNQLSC